MDGHTPRYHYGISRLSLQHGYFVASSRAPPLNARRTQPATISYYDRVETENMLFTAAMEERLKSERSAPP
jgi:hypothetical protein